MGLSSGSDVKSPPRKAPQPIRPPEDQGSPPTAPSDEGGAATPTPITGPRTVIRIRSITPIPDRGNEKTAGTVGTQFRYVRHVLRSEGSRYVRIFVETIKPHGYPLSELFGRGREEKRRARRPRRRRRRRRR